MKNAVFWNVTCLAFVRIDISKKRIPSIIRELGTTVAVVLADVTLFQTP
jgi:hypothetical protein